jgi:hypothetical protein
MRQNNTSPASKRLSEYESGDDGDDDNHHDDHLQHHTSKLLRLQRLLQFATSLLPTTQLRRKTIAVLLCHSIPWWEQKEFWAITFAPPLLDCSYRLWRCVHKFPL